MHRKMFDTFICIPLPLNCYLKLAVLEAKNFARMVAISNALKIYILVLKN